MKPELAERAAEALARAPVGADDAGDGLADATVDAMRAALRQRRRRRQQRRVAGAVGFVAVAAGIVVAVTRPWMHHEPPPVVVVAAAPPATVSAVAAAVTGQVLLVTKTGSTPLAVGSRIEVGDRVVGLKDARAEVRLRSGSRLQLEGGADLTVLGDGPTELFALSGGVVHADVMKLAAHERFIVRTSDAEIEVRGTSFRIAFAAPDPLCGKGTVTRVTVDEGVVAVRAFGEESEVRAKASWPSCEQVLEAPSASAAPPPTAPQPSRKPAAPKPVSDLAAQNDLFDRAMTAKRKGDRAAAVALLDRLLTTYPSSPLAEQAAAERAKLTRDAGP